MLFFWQPQHYKILFAVNKAVNRWQNPNAVEHYIILQKHNQITYCVWTGLHLELTIWLKWEIKQEGPESGRWSRAQRITVIEVQYFSASSGNQLLGDRGEGLT